MAKASNVCFGCSRANTFAAILRPIESPIRTAVRVVERDEMLQQPADVAGYSVRSTGPVVQLHRVRVTLGGNMASRISVRGCLVICRLRLFRLRAWGKPVKTRRAEYMRVKWRPSSPRRACIFGCSRVSITIIAVMLVQELEYGLLPQTSVVLWWTNFLLLHCCGGPRHVSRNVSLQQYCDMVDTYGI